jgi:hypothetical protein
MDKDEITKRLDEAAKAYADISNDILKLEECMGVRISIEITNLMGMAQVSVDVKTSPKGMKLDAHDMPPEVKEAIKSLAASFKDEEPAKPASEQVDDLLAKHGFKSQGDTPKDETPPPVEGPPAPEK